ncbi:MAG: FAD-dependent oxidoreductase, partial [Pseudomonadota bacterium]
AEHVGQGGEFTIFYMDMRCHGKEFDRYMDRAREAGVRLVRARPHTIDPGPNNTGVIMTYAGEDGKAVREPFDLAVLSVGMETDPASRDLAGRLGISLNAHRFAETASFSPVQSNVPGILVTGAFLSPKDIPQAVTEASAAAAEAARDLSAARGTLAREKTYPPETDVSATDPRVGVFVCSCGIIIAGVVDVQDVAEFARGLPGVVYVENNLFTCSTDTQALIAEKIAELNLNRVVVAACTPRTHEAVFADTLREGALNPCLVEMANIRNQCSWVHAAEPEKATKKAKDQVGMAVAKVLGNEPLDKIRVEVVPRALVVGGGLAGMTSALALAGQDHEVILVEKADRLGGNALLLERTWKDEPVAQAVAQLVSRVESHPKITVYKNARITSVDGSVGSFISTLEAGGETREITYGAAILAVGGKESRPDEYLYGEDPRVLTHLDFDQRLKEDPASIRRAESAVFIQCVGSRTPERNYCSRVCCTHTLKSSINLKQAKPDMNVFVLYRDIRTYGLRETLYQKARSLGVMFIRYDLEDKPRVEAGADSLVVTVKDHVLGLPLELAADLLVLAAAIEPADAHDLLHLYHASANEDGFFTEAHPKLRPVDMSADGLYIAGLIHYPKPVEETVTQALAAASRAGVLLSKSELSLSAATSRHNADICMSCLACFRMCPYNSPYINEEGRVAHNELKCTGCGICAGVCPAKAFSVRNIRDDQIVSMIDALTADLCQGPGFSGSQA